MLFTMLIRPLTYGRRQVMPRTYRMSGRASSLVQVIAAPLVTPGEADQLAPGIWQPGPSGELADLARQFARIIARGPHRCDRRGPRGNGLRVDATDDPSNELLGLLVAGDVASHDQDSGGRTLRLFLWRLDRRPYPTVREGSARAIRNVRSKSGLL
jgi:hypothetical protein